MTWEQLEAEIKGIKPMTKEEAERIAKDYHDNDPDMIKLDKEIKQLQTVLSIFTA